MSTITVHNMNTKKYLKNFIASLFLLKIGIFVKLSRRRTKEGKIR